MIYGCEGILFSYYQHTVEIDITQPDYVQGVSKEGCEKYYMT